jgi:hypothetical protein
MAVEPGINERGEEGRLGGGGFSNMEAGRRYGIRTDDGRVGERSFFWTLLHTSSHQATGGRTEKDEWERAVSQRYVVDKGGFRISLWNFPESAPSPQDEQYLEDQHVHLSSQWHACHPFH